MGMLLRRHRKEKEVKSDAETKKGNTKGSKTQTKPKSQGQKAKEQSKK